MDSKGRVLPEPSPHSASSKTSIDTAMESCLPFRSRLPARLFHITQAKGNGNSRQQRRIARTATSSINVKPLSVFLIFSPPSLYSQLQHPLFSLPRRQSPVRRTGCPFEHHYTIGQRFPQYPYLLGNTYLEKDISSCFFIIFFRQKRLFSLTSFSPVVCNKYDDHSCACTRTAGTVSERILSWITAETKDTHSSQRKGHSRKKKKRPLWQKVLCPSGHSHSSVSGIRLGYLQSIRRARSMGPTIKPSIRYLRGRNRRLTAG